MPSSIAVVTGQPVYSAGSNIPTRDYLVFGGVLRSEMTFPELTAARSCERPDWNMVVACDAPRSVKLRALGERRVGEDWYRLWRTPEGVRLEYSHAGTFDIARGGSLITWYQRPDVLTELVRSIVLGPAMALALELSGLLCLHGSAVALGERGFAFLGPKYFGKSTLATALTAAGARLIGDDLLAIAPGPPAMVRPGVASVRLWDDMARMLAVDRICDTLIPGVKTTATGFTKEAIVDAPVSLGALFLLSPARPSAETRAAWRTRLGPVEAAVALAHQTKLPDTLIGLPTAGAQLASAAALAATVPMWTLHVVRDVARLRELVEQVITWSR